jgi:hypothetical protein
VETTEEEVAVVVAGETAEVVEEEAGITTALINLLPTMIIGLLQEDIAGRSGKTFPRPRRTMYTVLVNV